MIHHILALLLAADPTFGIPLDFGTITVADARRLHGGGIGFPRPQLTRARRAGELVRSAAEGA
jgi:hypothetical protein